MGIKAGFYKALETTYETLATRQPPEFGLTL